MMRKDLCLKWMKAALIAGMILLTVMPAAAAEDVNLSDDASDFVLLSEAVPDAILEIRYYSTYNFVGERIDGYEEPLAFLTKEAAAALKEVSDDLIEQGYRLKIYDAYRPQEAVTHFMNWALDPEDTKMKEYFYPELEKDVLFPQGYIAEHSGHSRGSTVDLTRLFRRAQPSGLHRHYRRTVRKPHAPSGCDDRTWFQTAGRRMVALHIERRALSGHLFHIPGQQ